MRETEVLSQAETYELGMRMGEGAKRGDFYALTGDLGAGKTVFAQGFAKGLGISEHVNSPTFTILQVYEDGALPFYHFDAYRIGDASELSEIGFDDYAYGDGVCLMEWAEIVSELLPENTVWIKIEKDMEKGADYRKITIL